MTNRIICEISELDAEFLFTISIDGFACSWYGNTPAEAIMNAAKTIENPGIKTDSVESKFFEILSGSVTHK